MSKNGGEKLGMIATRVELLTEAVKELKAELKADIQELKIGTINRMDRHETLDSTHHQEINSRADRLESQSLEAGKSLGARIETVERLLLASPRVQERLVTLEGQSIATEAVTAYKRWLVGAVLLAALGLVTNLGRWIFPLIEQASK